MLDNPNETPSVDVHVETPETPPTPVVVETSSVPPDTAPSQPVVDHAEAIGRFEEWRREQEEKQREYEEWRNHQHESTQTMQETLSQLSNNVRELTEKVQNQPTMREVVLPLPVSETSDETPSPVNDDPGASAVNQTLPTSPVPVSPPLHNATNGYKPKVLHRHRH